MAAAYDTYDYPSYWIGREYENESDMTAIRAFVDKIPQITTAVEIGAGFGRLVPSFLYRSKKIILIDPSARLLKLARKNFKDKRINFIHVGIENITKKTTKKSADLVILVRVIHHLENIDEVLEASRDLLKDNGYLILEFANKCHIKARITQFLKGNFTFSIDIHPHDITSGRAKKQKTLPFLNFHPDYIDKKLKDFEFSTVEKRSVSNIRSPFVKKFFPINTLISLEKYLQKPLAKINFGPSIFILARKIG